MATLWPILTLIHLLGLGLAVGAAAVKLTLLLRGRADAAAIPAYLAVAAPVTRLIVVGIALATLSGIGFLALGRPLTPILIAKLGLVAAMWVLGPIIDRAVEPRFARLAPSPGSPASPGFARAQGQHLALEVLATSLLCAIAVLGVLI
ncbi:MAG TPA: hypothetical protein VLD85_01975 [Anaeromyxobacteraceae bacterium]|nr:hypothetical protein [Anaeromyxobacteraceae bacterium]